jgi:hypothetical protein
VQEARGGFGVLDPTASMQPAPIAHSILSAAHLVGQDPDALEHGIALVQCAIGLGLLFRPTVKPALLVSFDWALVRPHASATV